MAARLAAEIGAGAEAALLVTVQEFAALAGLSRRQIDRLRARRPAGFPREYELGSGASKYRRCPRFRLADIRKWLDSRALW
jgi:predicted DNA-binding transcriptional regulator AlpA